MQYIVREKDVTDAAIGEYIPVTINEFPYRAVLLEAQPSTIVIEMSAGEEHRLMVWGDQNHLYEKTVVLVD